MTTITSVGLSQLRDDWIAINTRASEEGDPVISCVFKTEFVAHLQQQTNGSVTVLIGPTVEYAKKKDKKALIKFTKDESVQKNDLYKSHEVRVGSGESPTSVSNPPAKRKPGVSKPIGQGKLLRPGGPGKPGAAAAKPRTVPKPQPKAQTLPSGNMPAPPPPPPTLGAAMNGVKAPQPPRAPAAPAATGAARVPPAPKAPVIPKAPAAVPGTQRAPPPPPSRPAVPPPVSLAHSTLASADRDICRHPQSRSGRFCMTSLRKKLERWHWSRTKLSM